MKEKLLLLFILFSFLVTAQNFDPKDDFSLAEEQGTNDVVIKDPIFVPMGDSAFWNPLPAAPNAFGRTVIGAIGEYVYVFASQNTTSMAAAYHIPSMTWIASTPCLYPGYNASYCVAAGELYKFSGTGSASNFEKFTPAGNGTGTWTSLPGTSTSLMNAQASMVWDGGNYIYAYSSGTSSPYPSYLSKYHLTNQTWEAMAPSMYPRRYAGLACLNGFIYLIGGLKSDASADNICQKYDLGTNTWSEIATLPESMNFTKWTVSNDSRYIYLIGSGGGYSSYPLSQKVYYYDPVSNTWALQSDLPAPRGLATGVVVTNYNRVFWGGGNDGTSGTNFQNNVWEGLGDPFIPVELASFSVSGVSTGILIEWSTSSEKNNSGFRVERKKSSGWETLIFVRGAGTTTEKQYYQYTDDAETAEKTVYRLAQVDFDGTTRYSQEIEFESIPEGFTLEQNYPNPFNPTTTINYTLSSASRINLRVTDLLGSDVSVLAEKVSPAGKHSQTFDASNLSSGVYFYVLTAVPVNSADAGYTVARKMILTK